MGNHYVRFWSRVGRSDPLGLGNYDLNILSMRFNSLLKIMKFFDKHKVRLILIGQGKDTTKPSGKDIFPQMLRRFAF